MRETVVAFLVTLLVLMGLTLRRGPATFVLGLKTSGRELLHFLPALVLAMLITGFVEVLLPKGWVERWLSDAAGWRGLVVAWLAGVLTPGGSMVGLPLIAVLYRAGMGLSVLITYATSFATLSLLKVPLEVSFYGWRLTTLRLLVSLGLPFIAGGLTQLVLPLFGR